MIRPRERYAQQGPQRFSDVELLALVLGTGVRGRSTTSIAEALLEGLGGWPGLRAAEVAELAAIPGVGPSRAIRLHAALQVGLRAIACDPLPTAILTPRDAALYLQPLLRGLPDEELHALYLDRRHRPIGHRVLSKGTDGYTLVDPRQVFRAAVRLGACAVVLAHNHPSGDPTPSREDREVTRRVAEAGRTLGVQLLDHLVVGGDRCVSLADEGCWALEPARSQHLAG